ncbi:MAG: DUF1501 domain-containing protein, partial [Gemmataceae bacterium]|nr:DUF1501 domain-containing protein [Gemmataceae bacterium]
PPGTTAAQQQDIVAAVAHLSRLAPEFAADEEIATRLAQYEMAFRMQTSVPALLDFRDETQATLDLYGARPGDGSFASNCLLARRLAERGVRFIQLYHRDWDHHNDLKKFVTICAAACDRASAALVLDLKQRGMLDSTLVIWGGEFGRTPMNEERDGSKFLGRDHHPLCFTIWMAGGGVKAGHVHGETDEFGYSIVRGKMSVHDLQATILHQLGLDAHQLSYRYQGLDQRLIGPA